MESSSSSADTPCSRAAAATRSIRRSTRSSSSAAPGVPISILHRNHVPQRHRVTEILLLLCVSASLRPVPAYAQYEAPPFDSIHLAVPEISQARDWYLKNIGGNVGET